MIRKQSLSGSLVLALGLLTLAPVDAAAQRVQRGSQGDLAATALRLSAELNLAEEQRASLETLRLEMLEDRQARMAALMALRSDIASGAREREAMRREVQTARAEQRELREEWRTRFQEILTDDQKAQLRELRPQARRQRSLQRRGVGRTDRPAMRRQDGRRHRPGIQRGRSIR